jgi:hypothetical protein
MAHNYILQVTTGTEYDITKHKIVPVNSATPVKIESKLLQADVNVRIQVWYLWTWICFLTEHARSLISSCTATLTEQKANTALQDYRGLPKASPTTSPYFDTAPHDKNKDQYSICFRFKLHKSINGNDLVFGNDFDHPIRDRLPPGFSTAFKIVKWVVDPGLDGDVYAEKPYLYGPAASSVNTLFVGSGEDDSDSDSEDEEIGEEGMLIQEGGSEAGLELRREKGVPDSEAARKKYFLNEERRKEWDWEAGREYGCDFFNPYLDFNDFALRLPGFTLPIMKYWDGQGLRYVTNPLFLTVYSSLSASPSFTFCANTILTLSGHLIYSMFFVRQES